MQKIKSKIRDSRFVMGVIAMINYPFALLFLQANQVINRITDWYIKNIIHFFMDDTPRSKRVFNLLARHFMPDRFTDKMAKKIQEHNLPLKVSIASSLFLRHSYCDNLELPEWKVNPKLEGRKFAREIGLATPEVFIEKVAAEKIPVIEKSVIKPVEGYSSNGVFAVYKHDHILEFKTGKIIRSWEELLSRIKRLLYNQKVEGDAWMVEEFICDEQGNPAHDLKFNSFYGQIGWIDEMTRYPGVKYNIMDAQGTPFRSELYGHDQFFVGDGVTIEEIELARSVSLEIPAPFIRIDFLRVKGRLLLGEFTPRPGVIGFYNRRRDQLYGRLFHEAEARLYTDLISGKRFEAFKKITRV